MFAATTNPELSRTFYETALGLQFLSDQPHALVFAVGEATLRVQKVEKVLAPPYTSLGFEVEDIADRVAQISKKDVVFEQYDFLDQDESGVWTTPDGAKIAWCRDPDGNLVSFTQAP